MPSQTHLLMDILISNLFGCFRFTLVLMVNIPYIVGIKIFETLLV